MPKYSAPAGLLDVGLFFTVALIGFAALTGESMTFRLAIALHILLRIYDGHFAGWRKVTWLALMLVAFCSMASGFMSSVFPLGQVYYWLASKMGEAAEALQLAPLDLTALLGIAAAGVSLFALSVVVADICALHARRLRGWKRWQVAAFLIAAFLVPGIIGDVVRLTMLAGPEPSGLPTPDQIVPSFDQLAFYAILRAVPDKALGVALLAVVVVLPVVAAWTKGWRLHAPQTRTLWLVLWLGLCASWVGLTVFGLGLPGEGWQWSVMALIAYQLIFYLVATPLLARYARPEDLRADVFA